MATSKPPHWRQNPFSTLPSEIFKMVMLWTATSDLLDVYPETERPDGHSILPIMLTNKQFYQEVSELIYEKQAFNVFINGSNRLRDNCPLSSYMEFRKKVSPIPWHLFRKVRIHLKLGISVCASLSRSLAVEDHGLCMAATLTGYRLFCQFLRMPWRHPKLRRPMVEVVCYEGDGSLAFSTPPLALPSAFPTMQQRQMSCWNLSNVFFVVSTARIIRDLADDTQRLEVSVRLPNLTYIMASNEEMLEAQVGRQCSEVLRAVWGNKFEWASYYKHGWRHNGADVIAIQLKYHLKWLDDEESRFQFLVVRDLSLVASEEDTRHA